MRIHVYSASELHIRVREMHVGFHVKCPFYCPFVTKLGMHQQILVKLPSFSFYDNPFSSSLMLACRQTGLSKLVIPLCDFAATLLETV
jgi:hypothetical protein